MPLGWAQSSQAGKTQSSSKLGGWGIISCLPGLSPIPPPPPPPLHAWAGFLSQSSCVLVVTKTEGGGQETRWRVRGSICWECEAGCRGPLTQSLLCLPRQLDCILILLEASIHHHNPPAGPPAPAPGKGASGGAKKKLQGSSSKREARERLGNGLAVLGVWVWLTGHSPVEEAVARQDGFQATLRVHRGEAVSPGPAEPQASGPGAALS